VNEIGTKTRIHEAPPAVIMTDEQKPHTGAARTRTRRARVRDGGAASSDWFWGVQYEAFCEHRRQIKAKDKLARQDGARTADAEVRPTARLEAARVRLRIRYEAEGLGLSWWRFVELMRGTDPDAAAIYRAECQPEWRVRSKQSRDARRIAVTERGQAGFVWPGGAVGCNPAYQLGPLRFSGLVSDHHPILRFFASKLPRGRDLTCGDHKALADSAPHGSKLLGCDAAYIDGLKPMRGFLRVEVDRPLKFEDIERACQEAGIPSPNIAVGWMDAAGSVRNPHLIWLLHNSVAFTPRGKPRFKLLFQRVLAGITAALLPMGADPGGMFNSMRVKNPLSPVWRRHIYVEAPYTLDALRACVDMTVALPEPRSTVAALDHPDLAISVGSNAAFRYLALWARQEVRRMRDERAVGPEAWRAHVDAFAEDWADRLPGLNERNAACIRQQVRKLARQVADWTWVNVKPARHATPLSPAEIASLQANAGRATGEKRAARSRTEIVAAALRLKELGGVPTQAGVQAAVCASGRRISLRSVERHWPAVREALLAAA
jgi:Replicase family